MKKPFTPSELPFESYKRRLYSELTAKGLSCKDISEDADIKQYVSNYVINLHSKVAANAILGISFRLANLNLTDKEHSMEYPVINKYSGHDIIGTYYFRKDSIGRIEIGYVEIKPSGIIIPNI